ncbi:MAG: penicillin-binding protein 2 [Gammaproteobacteria bacterium]|nr:penicillin-binding protein 2 [Gammaproteobacteria bacterium]
MAGFNRPQTYLLSRLNIVWAVFIIIFAAVIVRLFYVQIVRHEYFATQADAIQIESLKIEADRGKIYAFNGGRKVPLVINQRRWTMFSDALQIEDLPGLLGDLRALGVDLDEEQLAGLREKARYVVLERGVTDERRAEIIAGLNHDGIFFQKQSIREYTEGGLAAQVLGFLNADSAGQYGVEQFYNQELTGVPGRLRTTTDVRGVPLLFVEDNVLVEPQPGQDIVLTIDVPLQRIIETQLAAGIEAVGGRGGTALVLDAETGAVLAMANNPSFDPANFREAELSDYVNDAVESVLEPASTMKVLTMATALDRGAVGADDTYYNPEFQIVDGLAIVNFLHQDPGYRPVADILALSLNTGTTEMLKRLGEGPRDTIDLADRQALHDYYKQRFRLSQKTGIDLPNEVAGFIHPPDHPWSPNHLYSTMTFGQSITVTPLQLASAYAAIFNGGDYYRPYVVAQVGDEVRQPEVIAEDILKPETIADMRELMVEVGQRSLSDVQYEQIEVSGKTGSAQIVNFETGGYVDGAATGLMIGYIKSSQQTLVVAVIVEEPQVVFAGGQGARPAWKEIVKNIVALGRVSPESGLRRGSGVVS